MKNLIIISTFSLLLSSCYSGKKFPKNFRQAEKYIEMQFEEDLVISSSK